MNVFQSSDIMAFDLPRSSTTTEEASTSTRRSSQHPDIKMDYARAQYILGILFDFSLNRMASLLKGMYINDARKARLLCILTSFWVLRSPESWSKYFFQPFSSFFVHFKHFSVISCLKSPKNM